MGNLCSKSDDPKEAGPIGAGSTDNPPTQAPKEEQSPVNAKQGGVAATAAAAADKPSTPQAAANAAKSTQPAVALGKEDASTGGKESKPVRKSAESNVVNPGDIDIKTAANSKPAPKEAAIKPNPPSTAGQSSPPAAPTGATANSHSPTAQPPAAAAATPHESGAVVEAATTTTATVPIVRPPASAPAHAMAAVSAKPATNDQAVESKLRTDVKLRDVYKLGRTLGTGGFSVVKLAADRVTGKEYACKIMALPPVGQEVGENENTREDIFKEIDLLCGMNHSNVIYLKEYFEEGNKVYLITELLTGGELLEAVLKRGNYSEDEARLCFVQVLRGIEYLHSKNVVHRDLKLENLLLAKQDDISLVKIADFGLAKHAVNGMQTICGTPQYVAPEVIVGQKGHVYGPGVDMWSAGVVLYILLGGYPPFWSDSEPQLFDMIRKGKYSFNDPVWNKVSESAKDLIRKLLVVDPTKRLTATEALEHEFIKAGHFPPAPPAPDR